VVPKHTSSIHLEILGQLSTQLLNEEFVKLVKEYKTKEVYKQLRMIG
jgi:mannitol/fructose-specific phosphotransferase system IIA component (Ntr-type)